MTLYYDWENRYPSDTCIYMLDREFCIFACIVLHKFGLANLLGAHESVSIVSIYGMSMRGLVHGLQLPIIVIGIKLRLIIE